MMPYLDLSSAYRPNQREEVTIQLPLWALKAIEAPTEAAGLDRATQIETWIIGTLTQDPKP